MKKIDYNEHLRGVYKIVSFNVTRIRRIRGMTKSGLVKTANISRSTLDSLEERAEPKHFTTLIKIADALGVSLGELFKPISEIPAGERKIEELINGKDSEVLLLVKLIDRLIERQLKNKS